MTGDLDSRPPRPFLPPLLVAGLVLWAATAQIWPTLRLAPTAALPVLGMLALGAAVWLASHALRAARGGGFSLGALAALLDFAARRIRSDGGEKPPLARGLENAALFPLVLAAITL